MVAVTTISGGAVLVVLLVIVAVLGVLVARGRRTGGE